VGKQGHTVVERNRLRRQMRELARLRLIPGCARINVILKALPNAYKADFKQLSDEVNEIKLQLVAAAGD
jgi:ribonuclease P protein component